MHLRRDSFPWRFHNSISVVYYQKESYGTTSQFSGSTAEQLGIMT